MTTDQHRTYWYVHGKIQGIKAIRLAFHLSLRDSKDIVDSLVRGRPMLMTFEQIGKLQSAIVAVGGMSVFVEAADSTADRLRAIGPAMELHTVLISLDEPIDLQPLVDAAEAEASLKLLES